jgi:hypothetical protein
VLPGFASPNPPAYDWLPPVRAAAERMNDFLAAPVAFGAAADRLGDQVRDAVRGCGRVDLLVLGPWTSYRHYASALRGAHIVASGRSFAETNPDNFNCEYDVAALSLVTPRVFAPVGGHLEPTVGEDELRTLLVEAIN